MNLKRTMTGTVLALGLTVGASSISAEELGTQTLNAMKSMTHSNFQVVWNESAGTPSFISGKLSEKKVSGLHEVKQYLEEKRNVFQLDPDSDLEFVKKKTDDLGMTHYTFKQTVNGVPVFGAEFTVHTNKKDYVSAVTGAVHPQAANHMKNSLTSGISKNKAVKNAWDSIGLTKEQTKADDGDNASLSQSGVKNSAENAEMVVYSHNGTNKLAYHVELQFIYPKPANWQIFVDADNGSVIDSYNAVTDAEATKGTGTGVLGDTKELNTYLKNGQYQLYDVTNPMNGVIETYTAQNGSTLPGALVTDSDNAFTADKQAAAVDAHAYADKVFDYYYTNFDRVSYDDNGASIRSTVHYGNNYNNAFWNGQQMVYGDGDGQTFAPLSGALDVVAHELTHAVTGHSAGLVYRNQPGALNESMSDVFAAFVDRDDYLLGEDVYTPGKSGDALRSISNPPAYDQPAHMQDYVETNQDNGGVHINSGIPNKAAYLTMESIGKDKAEKIYYRALTVYLNPYSNFSDARAALLQSAKDIYGQGSEYDGVARAWDQIGVQ
ncbi:M4 family metallopeptidase [Virgibacillus siamensis]|uniref:M4 family metallopeptidase n=1 Tax=Virgibacillus siamensis TaxID=480071 RepID=UPI000984F16A|nr:M4 family metallopeptidase [Virgibacillus siamensis]